MKKEYREDDKYIYETTPNTDEYIEVPKKKKKRGLKIFLGIFITLLLLPFVIFGIICFMLYKNYDNPKDISSAESLNIKQTAEASLSQFFENEGNKEYQFSISEQTINKTLYTELYQKQNKNFLTSEANEYFKMIGDANSPFYLGIKGAWLKIDKNLLTVYAGVNVIKPIKFKTGVSVSFNISDINTATEQKYELKLNSVKVGKTKISLNLLKKILKQLEKNEKIKNQLHMLFENGYPKKDPIITFKYDDFSASIDKIKLFNIVEEKAKGHYDETKAEKVKILFNHLRNKFLQGEIFVLNFDNASFNFLLKANKIKAEKTFTDLVDKYEHGTRMIDLVRIHQQDILLNLNNVTLPTNFNINIDSSKLPKLFRFFADQNGFFSSSIFKSGKKIKINGLNNSFGIKVEPINMIGYSKNQMTIEAYAYIFPINNETGEQGKKIRTNIILGVKPEIQDGDLRLIINEFKWGQTDKITNDLLEGVFAFVKQKGVEENTIVIKDIFKKLKNQSGFDCQKIIFHEDKVSLQISLSGELANTVKEIKEKVSKVLKELKAIYPEVADKIDKLIEIAGGGSSLLNLEEYNLLTEDEKQALLNQDFELAQQKVHAINEITQQLVTNDKIEQFKKDLFMQTTASLDREALKVLNLG